MICPDCGSDTQVIDSRPVREAQQITRRRRCLACKRRFTTVEVSQAHIKRLQHAVAELQKLIRGATQ